MRWYITVAAVHDFQRIAGLPIDSDGPVFDRAAKELDAISLAAVFKRENRPRSGGPPTHQYEAKATLGGKRVRLELHVRPDPRPEGPLPQLVRVRRK